MFVYITWIKKKSFWKYFTCHREGVFLSGKLCSLENTIWFKGKVIISIVMDNMTRYEPTILETIFGLLIDSIHDRIMEWLWWSMRQDILTWFHVFIWVKTASDDIYFWGMKRYFIFRRNNSKTKSSSITNSLMRKHLSSIENLCRNFAFRSLSRTFVSSRKLEAIQKKSEY